MEIVVFDIQFANSYILIMRKAVLVSSFFRFAFFRFAFLTILLFAVSGCQTVASHKVAAHEFIPFNAMPAQHRIMNQVRINWEVRDDVAHVCAHAYSMGRQQAYLTPPVACAIWDILKAECTVVTGPLTSHVALGHELRHCFEGHYHR